MGIIPKDVYLTYELAKLDLPVPDKLMTSGETSEWAGYVKVLPIDKALKKFGEATDQYIALATASADHTKLDIDAQELLYSKWNAASWAAHDLKEKLGYPQSDEETKNVGCNVGYGLHFVVDAIRRLNSSDLPEWEARHAAYKALDPKNDPRNLRGILSAMRARTRANDETIAEAQRAAREAQRQAPKPPQP